MTTSVNFQNVSLSYKAKNIYDLSLKQKLIRPFKQNTRKANIAIESINDLSVSLRSGDRIGVLGRNGAGKSSLLKLIAGIYPPTQGTISVKGKINSIMNVSLGMNSNLSGYENIIHKGILLGLKIKDIKSKIKQITEFAELEGRLYHQLSTYSSGMSIRLALGILLAVESDILLIDEMVGALDTQFMSKYHQVLMRSIDRSAITVFVSHSFEIISAFCSDVIWLENGKLKEVGEKNQVIQHYIDSTKG